MCQTITTQHSCGHMSSDIFPCNDILDGKPCAGQTSSSPSTDPPAAAEVTKCSSCLETEHMEAALSQISTNPSLAPVVSPTSHSASFVPNTPAQTREFFPRCGHYARLTRQPYFREMGDPEWLDLYMEGSCYGCCEAHPRVVEELKRDGRWGDDPWGELDRVVDAADTIDVAGVGEGSGSGSGSGAVDSAWNAPPPAPPATLPSIGHIYDDEDDDGGLYDASNQSLEGDGEDPHIDSSTHKNKGRAGPSPAALSLAPPPPTSPATDPPVYDSGADTDVGSDEDEALHRLAPEQPPPDWSASPPATACPLHLVLPPRRRGQSSTQRGRRGNPALAVRETAPQDPGGDAAYGAVASQVSGG